MNAEYMFCPRCGAVTKPGTCTNCGYQIYEESGEDFQNSSESDYQNDHISDYSKYESGTPQNKGSKVWIVVLAIIGGLIVFSIVVLVLIWLAMIIIPFAVAFSTIKNLNNYNNYPSYSYSSPQNPGNADPDEEDDSLKPFDTDPNGFDMDKFNELTSGANELDDKIVDSTDKADQFVNGSATGYLSFSPDHTFHDRDSFPKPYLENLCDSYVAVPEYSVERHILKYEDEINSVFVNATCAYYQINSDDKDFTDVNLKLKNYAYNCIYDYISNDPTDGGTKTAPYNYTIYCDAIITFNNEDVISIVYDYQSYADNVTDTFFVHGFNIDTKNAVIMDNTKILNLDEDFAKFFVQRSNIQNSYVSAINNCTPSELKAVFNDDKSLILFFSPLGIEVGVMYRVSKSFGWVTITLNDFDQYRTNDYDFPADWGKQYDIYQYEKDNNITPKTGYGSSSGDLSDSDDDSDGSSPSGGSSSSGDDTSDGGSSSGGGSDSGDDNTGGGSSSGGSSIPDGGLNYGGNTITDDL